MSEEWRLEAACQGMDASVFFPARGESTQQARAVCNRCPVSGPCLQYALDQGETLGIYGGMSSRERRPLLKARPRKRNRCRVCGKWIPNYARTCSGECREISRHRLRVVKPGITQGTVPGFWGRGWGEAS